MSDRIEQKILAKAKELGFSSAGIARVEDLKKSRSFEIYDNKPYYPEYKGVEWNPAHKSVLVWALAHPPSEPILDWWSLKVPGFTPGNRVLRKQSRRMRIWLDEEFGIKALSLPYQIEYGGTFLKDSAVLAGLGVIGKNNLLVSPKFGSDLRLRGMFIEAALEPTGPIGTFDPCNGCDRPCHAACPRGAFRNGAYDQSLCKPEMDQNDDDVELMDGPIMGIEEPCDVIIYCRGCENACPVGKEDADLDFILREAKLG
jgi:epoxyqueuosine reductase